MTNYNADELVRYLAQARDLEAMDCRLLDAGVRFAKDDRVREFYVTHRRETEGHLEAIEACLENHDAAVSQSEDGLGVVGVLELRLAAEASRTPTQLAISAFAFENLEIAVYHLLGHLAESCDDASTAHVVRRILAEEERAAEMLAATLDRALDASLATTPDSDGC